MKALRRKDTKEWLAEIYDGRLYTGEMPKPVSNAMMSVEQIAIAINFGQSNKDKHIDLSDYELVEIELVVKENKQ